MHSTESRAVSQLRWATGQFTSQWEDQHNSVKRATIVKNQEVASSRAVNKQVQNMETLEWISQNYELSEGVCLPRCVLYQHYLDFCSKRSFLPAGPATFGKIIRQRFPKITTRRLGTRGQSKYHYYGIGIKESSIYFKQVYTGKGLSRFSGLKVKTENTNRKYSLTSKTGTLLPEFPEIDDLLLNGNIEREKVLTFLMMYRTHCQRILDTVISANFQEVEKFLLHFWQGMPPHLQSILDDDVIADMAAVCDSILYKVKNDVLVPSSIQEIPESICYEIKAYISNFPVWLENSLQGVPQKLREKKMQAAKRFSKCIQRQLSFIHLAQTTKIVLNDHDLMQHMMNDLTQLDVQDLCTQLSFMAPIHHAPRITQVMDKYYPIFSEHLKKMAPLEDFMEWLDDVIDTCVMQPINKGCRRESVSVHFVLQWSYVVFLFMRELTLKSAPSFGSFHLLGIMFDEYVQLVLESLSAREAESNLHNDLKKHLKKDEHQKTEDMPYNDLESPTSSTSHGAICDNLLPFHISARQRDFGVSQQMCLSYSGPRDKDSSPLKFN